MLALFSFVLAQLAALQGVGAGEVRARWSCEPQAVELGAPFALVLELVHPAALSARELSAGELALDELSLDESWVVLGEESSTSEREADGMFRSRRAWRVSSLEPGERTLSGALSRIVLSERVTHIQVGEARVRVGAVLAPGEDAPRPLREFPAGFAGEDGSASAKPWILWLALSSALLAGAAGAVWWRRRRLRRTVARPPTALERLGELERSLDGARGSEGCFELTRLLRAAGDGLRQKSRSGLTDEEWLAEITASLEVPRNAVSALVAVFERTGRVKYAGEAPTPWAMQETFQRARTALEVLGAGAPSAGATRA